MRIRHGIRHGMKAEVFDSLNQAISLVVARAMPRFSGVFENRRRGNSIGGSNPSSSARVLSPRKHQEVACSTVLAQKRATLARI